MSKTMHHVSLQPKLAKGFGCFTQGQDITRQSGDVLLKTLPCKGSTHFKTSFSLFYKKKKRNKKREGYVWGNICKRAIWQKVVSYVLFAHRNPVNKGLQQDIGGLSCRVLQDRFCLV